jgi:peptidoglycan/xylan/chitin deacetylase (PgdA/CDA1 family)
MPRFLSTRRAATYGMRLLPVRAFGRLLRRTGAGLCYHLVAAPGLPHVRPLYPYKSPGHFAADLRWLKRRFRVVSYAELQEAADAGRSPEPGWVHQSFDDGYAECFTVARPILLEHDLPCTFFLATDVLDNRRSLAFNRVALALVAIGGRGGAEVRAILGEVGETAGRPFADVGEMGTWLRWAIRDPDSPGEAATDRLCALVGVDEEAFLRSSPYMTGEQARTMVAEGFTIGGHTRLPWQLGRTAGAERVEREIAESCRVAAELSGQGRVPFAFPYDATGVDRAFLAGVLARNPHVGLLFGTAGLAPDAPFMVNRFLVDTPPAVGAARTNLGGLFRGAYLEEILRRRAERARETAPRPSGSGAAPAMGAG